MYCNKLSTFLFAVILLLLIDCSDNPNPEDSRKVQAVTSVEHFNNIIEKSGDRLLVFDLYADWCMPCRVLSPTLEEIASENSQPVSLYKIDTDKFPQITAAFGVTGIPFVVFVRNRQAVYALLGVQPKDTYLRLIKMYTDSSDTIRNEKPPSRPYEGIRVININPKALLDDIYVHRGDSINIRITPDNAPYSLHIPSFRLSCFMPNRDTQNITFKAQTIGIVPIFSTSYNPGGSGLQNANIIIMPEKGHVDKRVQQISLNDLFLMHNKQGAPKIIDVRTPQEYYRGHLKDACLLPLQQLEARLNEIITYQDSPIVIYCLADQRSSTAASILTRYSFNHVYILDNDIRNSQDRVPLNANGSSTFNMQLIMVVDSVALKNRLPLIIK